MGGYDVLIADGLSKAGQRLAGRGLKPGRCAVITNPTVGDTICLRWSPR